MENIKKNFLIYGMFMLDFYLFPFFIKDTGSGMSFMLIIIPAFCFLTSFAYGLKNGFHCCHALIVAVMFIPSIFIFYNPSAWIYMIVYGILALLGNITAVPFRKR